MMQKDPLLYEAAKAFNDLAENLDDDPNKIRTKGANVAIKAGKVIVKIIARFASTLNHQIYPTIFEEVARELSVLRVIDAGKLLQSHWTKVKRHSEECWEDNRNGGRLLSSLLQQQLIDPEFKINALSHSAGSLVIGKLIEKLGPNNSGSIDTTVMLVPAISLELFQKSIMRYPTVVRKLSVYPLTDRYEMRDELLGGIYPASLLYGVSGMGETTGFGDKPLMLQRHMGQKTHPYNKWYYRTFIGEDIRPIWLFIKDHPDMVQFYPFYPAKASGATHECTKYPWRVEDLAQKSMSQLSGLDESEITISTPTPTLSCKPATYFSEIEY